MRPWLAAALLLPLPAAAEEGSSTGPAHKVGVVAFAPLSGDVPLRSGEKAAAMLSKEIENADGLQLMEPKRPPAPEPFRDALAQAKAAVDQARGQRTQHKFRLAEESLRKALGQYQQAAAGLADVGELQDAYALLCAVQFNTGQDEEAQKSLAQALTLAPARELPLAATSPLFARVVAQARQTLDAATKGQLLVDSTPTGAMAFVDGTALGTTPLKVRDVPPGAHLWRVQLPSGDAAGGIVDVPGGKAAKVSGQIAANDPESKLVAALTRNVLDASAVTAAKDAAASLDAEWLLFGALSREGKNVALDAFLLDVPSSQVRRLPRSTFDPELLSAGMELYNLAGEISHNGAKSGQAARVPGRLAEARADGATQVAEARYGASAAASSLDPDAPTDNPSRDGVRTPLQKSRKPLKK